MYIIKRINCRNVHDHSALYLSNICNGLFHVFCPPFLVWFSLLSLCVLAACYGEDVVFVNKVVINDMNFEDAYNEAIQQKSIAQQNADKQKIENEAAIAKAEADKQVAITNAEAEAQKTSIAAEAQAEANRKLAESLSDTLIEYQKIQKWDGKLPTVSGGNALVSIDPAE